MTVFDQRALKLWRNGMDKRLSQISAKLEELQASSALKEAASSPASSQPSQTDQMIMALPLVETEPLLGYSSPMIQPDTTAEEDEEKEAEGDVDSEDETEDDDDESENDEGEAEEGEDDEEEEEEE